MNPESIDLMNELARKCVALNIEASKEMRVIRNKLRDDILKLVTEYRNQTGLRVEQFYVNDIRVSLCDDRDSGINVEIDSPYILTHHGDKDIMDAFIAAIDKAQKERKKEEQSSD